MYSRNDLQFEYRDKKRAQSQQGFPFSTNSIKEMYEQGTLSLSPPLNTFQLYKVSKVSSLSILILHWAAPTPHQQHFKEWDLTIW